MTDVILDTSYWIALKEYPDIYREFQQYKDEHQYRVLFTKPNFLDLAKRSEQDELSGIIAEIADSYVAVEDYNSDEYLHSDDPLLLPPPDFRDDLGQHTVDFRVNKDLEIPLPNDGTGSG